MKRIQSACLLQTIHFQLKEDLEHTCAVRAAKAEYEQFKAMMEQNHVKYSIDDETVEQDGSITIRIKRQHLHYDCGDYMG